jgi:hypothetical protein
MLATIAKILEQADLEQRIEALEEQAQTIARAEKRHP